MELTQSAPLFLMVFMSVAIISLQIFLPDEVLTRMGFSLQRDDINVDEDLPNFFSAIRL